MESAPNLYPPRHPNFATGNNPYIEIHLTHRQTSHVAAHNAFFPPQCNIRIPNPVPTLTQQPRHIVEFHLCPRHMDTAHNCIYRLPGPADRLSYNKTRYTNTDTVYSQSAYSYSFSHWPYTAPTNYGMYPGTALTNQPDHRHIPVVHE